MPTKVSLSHWLKLKKILLFHWACTLYQAMSKEIASQNPNLCLCFNSIHVEMVADLIGMDLVASYMRWPCKWKRCISGTLCDREGERDRDARQLSWRIGWRNFSVSLVSVLCASCLLPRSCTRFALPRLFTPAVYPPHRAPLYKLLIASSPTFKQPSKRPN